MKRLFAEGPGLDCLHIKSSLGTADIFDLGEAMSLNDLALLMDSARVLAGALKYSPGTLISEYLTNLEIPC